MATGTVAEAVAKSKDDEFASAVRELTSASAKCARAWLESGGGDGRHPALADGRLRAVALEAMRAGLGEAYGGDGTATGGCRWCGGATRLLRRERAWVDTALGRVRVEMARHRCGSCGRSSRPREGELDIGGSMTLSARRLASVAGSEASYERADELVRELAGLNLGAKRIERTTRAVGADLEARRKAALEPAAAGSPAPALPERKSLKEGRTLCCALDGTGVPARPSETVGRAGKDGERAATREAKVGALWVSERDGAGRPRTVPGSVVLFAAVESAAETPGGESEFERRLLRELAAAGWAPEDVGFAVGDGAGWVRRLFDDWFPKSERVVDYYHAAEHLWAAARARHGPGDLAAAWAKKLCGMLKAGRVDDVLAELRQRGAGLPECERVAAYVAERRDRMRYDDCLRRGLPIGSGRVEAACKTVVGRRMKCAGMRWTVAGANPVLWLRCARLGGWFDDYWNDRLAA